jgi:His/Glu/Gln/Arg/opine family amino acid ABC transporter permease subunit
LKFDFSYTLEALPRLLEGALITIEVALIGFILSLTFGTLITILRTVSRSRVLNGILNVYISFIRGTPMLIQIFLVYYALPAIDFLPGPAELRIDMGPVTAGIVAITLNSVAFMTEILRGGLAGIHKGQYEAARALGIHGYVLWRKVVLPQLFMKTIPPLVNEFTQVLKATPLLAMITVVEMMRVSQQIFSANYHPVEVLTGTFVLYFLICFSVSRGSIYLERRFAVRRF